MAIRLSASRCGSETFAVFDSSLPSLCYAPFGLLQVQGAAQGAALQSRVQGAGCSATE